ncbi:MAG: polysaccharide deacetylase family protein [Clostridia bacterium]|nr:polysaccharide deacetylase family protein [Clostridia bacterium]
MKNISAKNFRNVVSNVSIAIMLIFLFSITYLGGAVGVFSTSNFEAIYNGNRSSNNVSIMINVYMGSEFIPSILETLKKHNAKATFFVGGVWVSKNSDLLKNIDENGHEIGNHGYWHKDHKNISEQKNQEEMYLNHKLVKSVINKDMLLFAPPSGSYSQTTLKVAASLGYKTIMWTKDTIDWRDQDETLIYNRATKNPCGGDLILMHPTQSTTKTLEKIIEFYINKGYKLTTVSENIS